MFEYETRGISASHVVWLAGLSEMEVYHLISKLDRHVLRGESWDWPTLYAIYPQTAAILKYCLQRAPRFV